MGATQVSGEEILEGSIELHDLSESVQALITGGVGSYPPAVSSITANTTLSTQGTVLCNNTADITVTLPSASANTNRIYNIKTINAGKVTVSSADLIDGFDSVIIRKYTSLSVQSNGTGWNII